MFIIMTYCAMLLFVLLFGCINGVTIPPVPKMTKQYLWTKEAEPTPYAHVCTISELENGNFVAAYQAGSGEGEKDCTIWHSIRDGNKVWGTPSKAIVMDKCTMNPSLYQNDEGILFLIYHYNGASEGKCSTHNWKGYYAVSEDGGKTFVNYTALPKGYLGSVKNNCIKLSNGEVLCPSSTEQVLQIGIWESHFEITNDEFSNWEKSNNVHFFHGEGLHFCQGIIQPTIFEEWGDDRKGHIRAMFRSSCGVLATAESTDYGKTWPEFAHESDLPNPGAGVDMIRMYNSKYSPVAIISYNNSTKHRTPLSLAYSVDNGHSWTHLSDIETDPDGSFEYPFMIQSRNDPNKAYVCYTYDNKGYNTLAFVELDFQ